MGFRKRVRQSHLESNLRFSPDGSADRCNNDKMMAPTRFDATQEGVGGKVSLLGQVGSLSGSCILLRWPWQQCVSMAAGLFLAGLLAMTQAWCVNTIHENLLWFSELTVGVIT